MKKGQITTRLAAIFAGVALTAGCSFSPGFVNEEINANISASALNLPPVNIPHRPSLACAIGDFKSIVRPENQVVAFAPVDEGSQKNSPLTFGPYLPQGEALRTMLISEAVRAGLPVAKRHNMQPVIGENLNLAKQGLLTQVKKFQSPWTTTEITCSGTGLDFSVVSSGIKLDVGVARISASSYTGVLSVDCYMTIADSTMIPISSNATNTVSGYMLEGGGTGFNPIGGVSIAAGGLGMKSDVPLSMAFRATMVEALYGLFRNVMAATKHEGPAGQAINGEAVMRQCDEKIMKWQEGEAVPVSTPPSTPQP